MEKNNILTFKVASVVKLSKKKFMFLLGPCQTIKIPHLINHGQLIILIVIMTINHDDSG